MKAKNPERFLVPRYKPAEVKFASGITEAQIHYYFTSNLLELTYRGHGYGKVRLFTELETVRLAIMSSLHNQGLAIRKARDVALVITASMETGKTIPENAIECIFSGPAPALKGIAPVTDWQGDLFHLQVDDPSSLLNDSDQLIVSMIVIPVGRVVREVAYLLEQYKVVTED